MLISTLNEEAILKRARKVLTLREVGLIAADVVNEYYGSASLVMTPVRSAGLMRRGRPSPRANLERLREVITELRGANIAVFNQLLFASVIDAHLAKWRESEKSHSVGYYEAILHDFYGPIIGTGCIKVLFLLPGWDKSRSCRYVRKGVLDHKGRVIKL